MKISSIFPAYNEECNIEESVISIIAFFKNNHINDWEVIVINDGSTDKTRLKVEKIIKSEKRVRLINHKSNKGYGKTLRSGLLHAKLDWIFITDSDLQFFINDLKELITFSDKYNFIQGIRTKRDDSKSRIILGKIYKTIVNIFFKIPVSDPECSFRLFKRNLTKGLKFYCTGPMVPIELILNSEANNAEFKEVSVRHRLRRSGETNALSFFSFKKIMMDFFILFYNQHSKNIKTKIIAS
tara:strand:- start:3150 stop:3869 length:720 start_codon:yes stop_codon:yes gene_type:complete